MCGLVAFLRVRAGGDAGATAPTDAERVARVRDRMATRGPDAVGGWQASDGSITLGHRRLAIRDLSEAAAQPFIDDETGVVLVYNGELYGCAALEARLDARGIARTTTSDTEVLLRTFLLDGPAFVEQLRGMYAYVIWDPRSQTLHVGRDVHGIKPLYMARSAEGCGSPRRSALSWISRGWIAARSPPGMWGSFSGVTSPIPSPCTRVYARYPRVRTRRSRATGA